MNRRRDLAPLATTLNNGAKRGVRRVASPAQIKGEDDV